MKLLNELARHRLRFSIGTCKEDTLANYKENEFFPNCYFDDELWTLTIRFWLENIQRKQINKNNQNENGFVVGIENGMK